MVQWYNKVTSETYSKVDSKNSTLLKKNADPKKLAFTNSDTYLPIPFKNDFEKPEARTFFHTKAKIQWLSRYKKTVKPDYLYLPEEKLKRIELTRIFCNFDEDNNNMLELDEFLDMILQNYLCHEQKRPFPEEILAIKGKKYWNRILKKDHHGKEQKTGHDSTKIIRFFPAFKKGATMVRTENIIQEFLRKKIELMYKSACSNGKSLGLDDFVRLALDPVQSEIFTKSMRTLKKFQESNIKKRVFSSSNNADFIPLNFDKMISFLSYRS